MNNPNDENQWLYEANAVINDVKNHVKVIEVFNSRFNNNDAVYLDVITLESKIVRVKLDSTGFRLVSKETNIEEDATVFETPQSLLSCISPMFIQSQAKELMRKLEQLDSVM